MTDPYFWAERPGDSSPKDITQFASGGSSQSDPDAAPHRIKDLDPGEYDIYVSDGFGGGKRGPTAHTQESVFYKNVIGAFSPVVLVDHEFMQTNPVLRARAVSDGTEQDFKISEIRKGELETFADGGDVALETWYDKSGNGNDVTPPSSGGGPTLVSGGTTATNSAGDVASDFAINDELTVGMSGSGGVALGLLVDPTASGLIANLDGLKVTYDGSDIIAKLKKTGSGFVDVADLPAADSVDIYNGDYYTADTVDNYIHIWDGSTTTTRTTPENSPRFVRVYDGNLYVGYQGGEIEKYDGSTWTTLSPVNETAPMGFMRVVGDYLYYGTGAPAVNRYDGSNFTEIGDLSSADLNEPSGLASFNGNLYVSGKGYYDDVAVWDGNSWANIYDGTAIRDIAATANALYTYEDDDEVYRNDGSGFSATSFPGNSTFIDVGRVMEVFDGNIWVTDYDKNLYSYNGSSWTKERSSLPGIGQMLTARPGMAKLIITREIGIVDEYNATITKRASVSRGSGVIPVIVSHNPGTSLTVRVGSTKNTINTGISRTNTNQLSLGNGFEGTVRRMALFDKYLNSSDRSTLESYL